MKEPIKKIKRIEIWRFINLIVFLLFCIGISINVFYNNKILALILIIVAFLQLLSMLVYIPFYLKRDKVKI